MTRFIEGETLLTLDGKRFIYFLKRSRRLLILVMFYNQTYSIRKKKPKSDKKNEIKTKQKFM